VPVAMRLCGSVSQACNGGLSADDHSVAWLAKSRRQPVAGFTNPLDHPTQVTTLAFYNTSAASQLKYEWYNPYDCSSGTLPAICEVPALTYGMAPPSPPPSPPPAPAATASSFCEALARPLSFA
jgi:hypothetical protein